MADDPVVGVAFSVELDKMSVGTFSSCEGLGLEVVMEQREEGGNNGLVWQLPTRPTKQTDNRAKKFGNATRVREDIYWMNTVRPLDTLWQDLKFAGRLLKRDKG